MTIEVIDFSGSPVSNSNTDRLVKAILNLTGLESLFVKLSKVNIRPCFACKQCVSDNVCKTRDDFPVLAEKIKNAKALVIGAYIPYGQIDAFTKALLERFWSLRHVNNLLRGKLCATVMTGLDPDSLARANRLLAAQVRDYERMELVGQLTVRGNATCASCGRGDGCEMSGLKRRYGPEAKAADYDFSPVEEQAQVWKQATDIGRLLAG